MNKNINNNNNKPLKGGSVSVQSVSDPLSRVTTMGFQEANNGISDATQGVSDNLQKANTFASDATQGVSDNLDAAKNAQLQAAQDAQKASSLVASNLNSQADKHKGFISEIIADTTDAVAAVESQILGAEAKVATTGAVAVADAVDDTIQTQGPKLMKTLQTATDFVADGWNIFKKAEVQANTEAETVALKIKQDAEQEQINILMNSGLTKEKAEIKFDILEAERKEKEAAELKIAEAAAAAATAVEIAEINANSARAGGSRKRLTLGQIQKGGRQSANRTKKSITDFFKSSVTSSRILKMILKPDEKHKRKTKVKRRKFSKRSRKR